MLTLILLVLAITIGIGSGVLAAQLLDRIA